MSLRPSQIEARGIDTLTADSSIVISQWVTLNVRMEEDLGILVLEGDGVVIMNF